MKLSNPYLVDFEIEKEKNMIRRRLFTLVGLVLVFVIMMSASVSSQGEFLNKEHGITFIMIERN